MPNPSVSTRRSWAWIRRLLAAGVLLFLAGAGAICVAGQCDDLRPSDVAVILGNRVFPGERPSRRLAGRLDEGVAVWRAGLVRAVIVSGGVAEDGGDEARVMRLYLLARGVPDAAILADPHGDNTLATARNTAALMRAHGWRTAMAVTQYYHIPRTRLALEQYGIRDVRAAHARYFEWGDLIAVPREVVAYPVYFLGRPGWL